MMLWAATSRRIGQNSPAHLVQTSNIKKGPNKKTKKQLSDEKRAFRFTPESITCTGCSLFKDFERFHLAEQQRASEDTQHTNFVKNLASGRQIKVEDITAYKEFTEDVAKQKEWMFAPVLVSTNLERLNISRLKARLWARENITHVLKWKCRLGVEINRPNETGEVSQVMKKCIFLAVLGS